MLVKYKNFLIITDIAEKSIIVHLWEGTRYIGWDMGFKSHADAIARVKSLIESGDDNWRLELVPF
ncbi:hypothetical protein H6F77_19900 [Microcoleus sp. FACHB-831]|uniref:hypothetical protein n=1 Tax=Microcoleus sp. FACHB-831 TaxID=2692827 RepID=UPI00168334A3|nr:hypothetical protein [Microcoleus sp. FACHB-831]MBD1923315.1 hypothetical protein [Microcoleus sp. FACHB-831]